ncbi:MAG: UvrD-helicase domain-containing protein [Candidatus Eremiobacteraeota bacterium]|nr:UvrD-helicase domain-containing protein [Candidatus Eremiobacteraeota bacterium]
MIGHPRAGGSLGVIGPAGSGKTFALEARAGRLASDHGCMVLITAPSDFGITRLREASSAAGNVAAQPIAAISLGDLACASFGDVAFEVLRRYCGVDAQSIDDITASLHFERAGASLFALEWTEFVSAEIDPEITGLRAPERFAAAAFRLIRKLRASLVSPEDFRIAGLRGATAFYAQAPNFADAALIAATPAKYRDSLRPSPAELDRQRQREIDLARILARLYASYVDTLVAHGCLTPTDAVYEAALALRSRPDARAAARETYGAILVDDAQDMCAAQLALLEGIAAEGMGNVTLAGDQAQNTRSFAGGGRGVAALRSATTVVELGGRYRSAAAIERAARAIADPASRNGGHAGGGLTEPAPASDGVGPEAQRSGTTQTAGCAGEVALYRPGDLGEEARYVAAEVARRIAAGAEPQRIALIARNLRCAGTFVDALLARGVSVDVAGAASLFDFRAVGDAFGALWSAVDLYRHDHLLRVLASPWMRLSDASLAILCGDAPEPQPLLFELPEDEPQGARAGRWDRRRDVRLGRNVSRGDVDLALSAQARERLAAFREARVRWEALSRHLEPAQLARLILEETVLATLRDDARGRFERHLLERFIAMLDAASLRDPLASLHALLQHLEQVADAEDDLLGMTLRDAGAVRILDVESAKGRTFEAVFAVDVRAGAWPRYYTPDAFLFLPSLGMVPKENVGDARAGRTAKFSYALCRYKLREKYDAEDRRALYTALTRAADFASISASGRATRGLSTPEFLEELRANLER